MGNMAFDKISSMVWYWHVVCSVLNGNNMLWVYSVYPLPRHYSCGFLPTFQGVFTRGGAVLDDINE